MPICSHSTKAIAVRINNASDEEQLAFFLWFLAIIIMITGILCLAMAPRSMTNTTVSWGVIAFGAAVTRSQQIARVSAWCWHRCRLVRAYLQPTGDHYSAGEVLGAVYVDRLPDMTS